MPQPLVHLHHVLLGDVEPLGQQLGRASKPWAISLLLLLAQLEEELALGLRGPQLHHLPVVHDVAEDVRADPPRGVAELSFTPRSGSYFFTACISPMLPSWTRSSSDERVAVVLVGQLHHQPQVRGHQPVGRLHVARLAVLLGQRVSSSRVSSGCRVTSAM